VTTDQVRIRITGSRLEPTLAEMGLFKQSVRPCRRPFPIAAPTAGDLSNLAGNKMVYTVDGSAPTTNSPVYNSPIACRGPQRTVQAASLLPNGQLGIAGFEKPFAGLMPIGWKVVSVDSEETAGADNSAANAIDGNSSTFWHTRWNADLALPHFITVDMGNDRIGLAGSPICRARMDCSTAWSKNTALKRARMA
jgi:alpha-L-fucosidase